MLQSRNQGNGLKVKHVIVLEFFWLLQITLHGPKAASLGKISN